MENGNEIRSCTPNNDYYEEDVLSLLDILIILLEGKKQIILTAILITLIGLGCVFAFNKPEYVSSFQLMSVNASIRNMDEISLNVSNAGIVGFAKSDAVQNDVAKFICKLEADKGKPVSMKKVKSKMGDIVKVDIVKDTSVVNVAVKYKTPEETKAIADVAMASLLKNTKKTTKTFVDYVYEEVKSEISKNSDINMYDRKEFLSFAENLGITKNSFETLTGWASGIKPIVSLTVLSKPYLPEESEPRGRGKTLVLFFLMGLFLGIIMAFVSYGWKHAAEDPETAEKVERIKELLPFAKTRK